MLKTINTGKKDGFAAYARSVEKWLHSLHPLFFIALVTVATHVVSLLAGVIAVVLEHVLDIVVAANNSTEGILGTMGFSIFSVFMVVVAAPILETVIFQHGVIRLSNRLPIFRGKRSVLILLSATAFGLSHWEPVFYVFHTFLVGLLLAYAYILKMERPSEAFWTVTAIHALRNLISFTLGFLVYL